MGQNTSIEWCDASWNPVRARLKEDAHIKREGRLSVISAGKWGYHCEHASPGCKNCYAERMNGRTLPAWGTGLAYTVPNREKVEIFLDETELLKPLKWKKPRKVFVCSMTDLFADFVSDDIRDRIFTLIGLAPALGHNHTFIILTKRAEAMRAYLSSNETLGRIALIGAEILGDDGHVKLTYKDDGLSGVCFKNCWLGVSCENQEWADKRIPWLLKTPAAVRFVSAEPLLGTLDLGECLSHLDWVIVGGESGSGARPFDIQWARDIIAQCKDSGVPCFVKQIGSIPVWDRCGIVAFNPTLGLCNLPPVETPEGYRWRIKTEDRKGGDPSEWPEDLRVREFPEVRNG